MKILKLLVIDHDSATRKEISKILNDEPLSFPFLDEDFIFEVLEASTGEQGIEYLETKIPDIILIENQLIDIPGSKIMDYIKQKQFDCQVAVLTSSPSFEAAVQVTQWGASDFITKPFTKEELKVSVNAITKQLFFARIAAKMKKEGKQVRYQFLSVLSHELKAPLNAITGYLEMMKDKQLGNNMDAYHEIIERSMERAEGMKRLIMDLLDFTKIRFEKSQKKVQSVILKDIANLAVDSIRPLAIQKDVSIKLDIDEQIAYKADPDDMEIIFNNLISNAVKYNRNGGWVKCKILDTEECLQILVQDSGIGMTEEETSKLFRDFVRIKNDKTRGITGSGLGLSIIKKLTQLYHGEISVESKENAGTKFIVVLPKLINHITKNVTDGKVAT